MLTIQSMNKYLFIAVAFVLLLSGCGQPIVYSGDKFPRTKAIEIYYSAKDIQRPYKVIGHIKAHKYSDNIERIDLIHFGKSIGADAVIVLGNDGKKYVSADAIKFN
jgi:hypothetical protein